MIFYFLVISYENQKSDFKNFKSEIPQFCRRFGLASSLFCLLIYPYSFCVCLPISNSKNIDSSWTSLLSWPRLGCCQSCGFRDPCFNLSIIGFYENEQASRRKTFQRFRNSQGRSRDAKDDQEDSPGDGVLATDQSVRGRMVRPWREVDGRILILGFRSISFLI